MTNSFYFYVLLLLTYCILLCSCHQTPGTKGNSKAILLNELIRYEEHKYYVTIDVRTGWKHFYLLISRGIEISEWDENFKKEENIGYPHSKEFKRLSEGGKYYVSFGAQYSIVKIWINQDRKYIIRISTENERKAISVMREHGIDTGKFNQKAFIALLVALGVDSRIDE